MDKNEKSYCPRVYFLHIITSYANYFAYGFSLYSFTDLGCGNQLYVQNVNVTKEST